METGTLQEVTRIFSYRDSLSNAVGEPFRSHDEGSQRLSCSLGVQGLLYMFSRMLENSGISINLHRGLQNWAGPRGFDLSLTGAWGLKKRIWTRHFLVIPPWSGLVWSGLV